MNDARKGPLQCPICFDVQPYKDCAKNDCALSTLSQEAVRDEALEKAAVRCENEGECNDKVAIDSAKICANAIRALKREPNAAASGYGHRLDGHLTNEERLREIGLATPAPAAPDVANALQAISRAEEVVFNAAIVADDRMRYEEAKNHRKLSDALKEAAALLSRLGQGCIGASDE